MKIDNETKAVLEKFAGILASLDHNLRAFDPNLAEQIAEGKKGLSAAERTADFADMDARYMKLIEYARDYQSAFSPETQTNVFNSAPIRAQ